MVDADGAFDYPDATGALDMCKQVTSTSLAACPRLERLVLSDNGLESLGDGEDGEEEEDDDTAGEGCPYVPNTLELMV